MAGPSPVNPLRYVIQRQYQDRIHIKNRMFKERLSYAQNLYRKDLLAHYGCVNAIEFSKQGHLLVSGGDDRRVLLWFLPDAVYGTNAALRTPTVMDTNHISNIFCLAFNSTNTRIFSGGNDDQVIVHDIISRDFVTKLAHKKPVYGLSVNPQNDSILSTAGDDGRILLFDLRDARQPEVVCVAKQKTGFHSVMFNPANSRWLATANSEEGIALWDIRKPKEMVLHYDRISSTTNISHSGGGGGRISGISACFNATGDRVLALRRRLPPVLYRTNDENAICQFYHPNYYNSCTMKTCCFAGDSDEYILSGSDDFNLYMWRMPDYEGCEWAISHMVLKGHRSIVNQVRYSRENSLIATSGVEKMVKLWSTVPIPYWKGSLRNDPQIEQPRTVYSHEDYIYLVGHSGERISHDYSDHSTQEDVKMMAFFDSLIQREIEGWESPPTTTSTASSCYSSDTDDNNDNSTHNRTYTSLLREMYRTVTNPLSLSQQHNDKKTHNHHHQQKNRIALLIAKRGVRLARMAHERAPSSIRYFTHKRKKNLKRKNKRKSQPQSISNSTSNNVNNKRATKRCKKESKVEPRKYCTRLSVLREKGRALGGDSTDTKSAPPPLTLDTPSTSTGITNPPLFRIVAHDPQQDSDDDQVPPNNNNNCPLDENPDEFVNILPTPLNGTHDMYINVLELASSVEDTTNTNGNSNRNGTAASTSRDNNNSSDLSDGSDDEDCFDSFYRTPVKRTRLSNGGGRRGEDSGCVTSGTSASSTASPSSYYTITTRQNLRRHHRTNNNNINHYYHAPQRPDHAHSNDDDADCDDEEGGTDSNATYRQNSNNNNAEKFRKRLNKAKMNIRKKIYNDHDSDSN